jgi:hypothetical protein
VATLPATQWDVNAARHLLRRAGWTVGLMMSNAVRRSSATLDRLFPGRWKNRWSRSRKCHVAPARARRQQGDERLWRSAMQERAVAIQG